MFYFIMYSHTFLWRRLWYPRFTEEETEPKRDSGFYPWLPRFSWVEAKFKPRTSWLQRRNLSALITSNFRTVGLQQWAVTKLLWRARRTENVFKITAIPGDPFSSLEALFYPFVPNLKANLFDKEQAQGHTGRVWVGHCREGWRRKERF